MKILIVSLVLWIFVVPCAVAACLILISLSAMVPNVYLVLAGLAVAFATLAIIRGPLWTRQSSKEGSPTNHQQLT